MNGEGCVCGLFQNSVDAFTFQDTAAETSVHEVPVTVGPPPAQAFLHKSSERRAGVTTMSFSGGIGAQIKGAMMMLCQPRMLLQVPCL